MLLLLVVAVDAVDAVVAVVAVTLIAVTVMVADDGVDDEGSLEFDLVMWWSQCC